MTERRACGRAVHGVLSLCPRSTLVLELIANAILCKLTSRYAKLKGNSLRLVRRYTLAAETSSEQLPTPATTWTRISGCALPASGAAERRPIVGAFQGWNLAFACRMVSGQAPLPSADQTGFNLQSAHSVCRKPESDFQTSVGPLNLHHRAADAPRALCLGSYFQAASSQGPGFVPAGRHFASATPCSPAAGADQLRCFRLLQQVFHLADAASGMHHTFFRKRLLARQHQAQLRIMGSKIMASQESVGQQRLKQSLHVTVSRCNQDLD